MGVTVSNTIKLRDATSSVLQQINGNVAKLAAGMNKAAVEGEKMAVKTKSGFSGIGSAIIVANQALGLLSAGFNKLQQAATVLDDMASASARIDNIRKEGETVASLRAEIMATANASRASYQDTAASVSKLALLAGDAFKGGNKEVIAFTELMNKSFVVAGASTQEAAAGMYQLTQAMAAGKLQGDEFRSIMENAPMVAQAIADYTGKTKGELKDMSAAGTISADIIKNAMFKAAGDINAKFNNMPMTFGQAMTVAKNNMLAGLQPVIDKFSEWVNNGGAQQIEAIMYGIGQSINLIADLIFPLINFVTENAGIIKALIFGIAGAFAAWAIITGVQTVVTWALTASNWALVAAVLANPLTWIVVAIAAVIAAIVLWADHVGGFRILWLIVVNAILTAWDYVKFGFMVGIYWILNMWDKMMLGIKTASTAIANFMGDMKANVLTILQNMVNGAIGIINKFIGLLNKIPGVNIEAIGQMTFGTEAQAQNEAEKQARNASLDAYKAEVANNVAERAATTDKMLAEAKASNATRSAEIKAAQAESAAKNAEKNKQKGTAPTGGVSDPINTKVTNDVSISEEDLKYMRDTARVKFINQFTTLRPNVTATFGDVRETADVNKLAGAIADVLETSMANALA